jgi:hypothetical protein
MEINPPIPERTNDQLLDIVETSDQWRMEVVELAQKELKKRGIPVKIQEIRRKNRTRYNRRIEAIKSRATYTTSEKVLIILFGPVLIVIFHDFFIFYAGEGYKKKNRQGFFYLLLSVVFWGLAFWIYFENFG